MSDGGLPKGISRIGDGLHTGHVDEPTEDEMNEVEEDPYWCPPGECLGISEDFDCGECPFQERNPEGWEAEDWMR